MYCIWRFKYLCWKETYLKWKNGHVPWQYYVISRPTVAKDEGALSHWSLLLIFLRT
jgi:hypothetical protein